MFKHFFTSGNLLLEDLNRTATWGAVGPKLVERLRAQDPATGMYDNHPIAYGLRHPEGSDEHEGAKEEFLDKIEGMSPAGHAKTYGPLIGRIWANGNHQFGEDDEGIRHAVQHYHELKSGGLFARPQDGLPEEEKTPPKFNNPSALHKMEEIHEVLNHPAVQRHEAKEAANVQATNDYDVVWQGKDKHGVNVTAYAPKSVQAVHGLYGVGKNGVKPVFPGGVGWCTVNKHNFDHYRALGQKSGVPLTVFKRDGEDHPFAQFEATTGQLHGVTPTGPETAPVKDQISRMRNSHIPTKQFDDYLPGYDAAGKLASTRAGREQRADRGNARNQHLGEIRRANDAELVVHAQHEDPEYRRVAMAEAGRRGVQQILAVGVDDPDRSVARIAISHTPDPAIHRRYTRPGAAPNDRIALAQNYHLRTDDAVRLFNSTKSPEAGPQYRGADSWHMTSLDNVGDLAHGDMFSVAKQLIDRKLPRGGRAQVDPITGELPRDATFSDGRRQTNYRRNPHVYQDALTHIGHSLLDNAAPHTAGAKDHATGRQAGQISVEEMLHNGDTSQASTHVSHIIDQVAARSLDEHLINRIEQYPNISIPGVQLNSKETTLKYIAQRGYRTKFYLNHEIPQVQRAAVVGVYPVVEGRGMKFGNRQFDGSTRWRKNEKGMAAMFKPELIDTARKSNHEAPLTAMVPLTKKWRDLKDLLVNKAVEQKQTYLNNTQPYDGSALAMSLLKTHKSDETLHDHFIDHPDDDVRALIASSTTKPHHLDRLIDDDVERVRSAALAKATNYEHWPIVHKALLNYRTNPDRGVNQWFAINAATKPGYVAWLANHTNQQNESVRLKRYIKAKLLENVL